MVFIKAKDGTKLYYKTWHLKKSKAEILLLHGLGTHIGRYSTLISALINGGYGVHAFDLRGHGRSDGKRGHVLKFETYIDDLEVILKHIGKKVFLIGHSLGGSIVLNYAIHRNSKIRGIIAISAWLECYKPLPFTDVFAKMVQPIMPTFTADNRLDYNKLSHDPKIKKAVKKDPLTHRDMSVTLYVECKAAVKYTLENAVKMNTPILFLHGDIDELTFPRAVKRFYKECSAKDKKLILYNGMYHELHNEIGKEKVFKDIISWLDKHANPKKVRTK